MPAETISAPSAPVSGGLDAAIDAIAPVETPDTSAPPALDTPGTTDAPSGDAPQTPPEVVTADDQHPDAEAELEAAVPEPDAPVDPYESDLKPDSVSKDGKRFFFNKGKAERLMSADKTLQQIRSIDPSFSTEQYQEMATRTLELDRMLTDYNSGDPERVAMVAGNFVSPNQNPESVAAFVDTAVGNAAQHYPQAFRLVQSKIFSSQANIYYQKYRQTGNASDKALAQNLDWLAKGAPANAVAGVHFIDPDAQLNAQANPLAAERAQFEQERSQYNLQRNQERQQSIQRATAAAENEAKSAVTQAIESALSIIPANVREAKSLEYKHAVRDLQDQFAAATDPAVNPLYSKQYQTALAMVKATPNDQTKANLVKVVKQCADWVVGKSKKDVLARFNATVMDQNTTTHQRLTEASRRIEPGGSNSPVQRATVAQKLRDPKLSYDDKFEAVFGR